MAILRDFGVELLDLNLKKPNVFLQFKSRALLDI
jgi:hypothetical protein